MTVMESLMDAPPAEFDAAAIDVLGGLRTALANVLASVGGVRKPADLQKQFKLDWTLSWQLFQVAGAGSTGSALAAGSNVPSRPSLKKFLASAQAKGVDDAKVDRVWTQFERFERLVEVHAGDRTSFNSMVSAAAGMDSEWLAADLQHRRNAYRAMSHMLGMHARTKHICGIYNRAQPGRLRDGAVVVGFAGLRMLRAIPHPLVFRMRETDATRRSLYRRVGLGGDPSVGGGFLMRDFSSSPLPSMRMRELDAGWIISELDHPSVGNLGACTLRFGTAFLGNAAPADQVETDREFVGDVAVDKPVEVLISDALVEPGLMEGVAPVAEAFLGNTHSDAAALPGDVVSLLGDYSVECLGRGPDVLATPDVPDYPDLMRSAAATCGWDINPYEVWRLRVEFPVYQSTVRMKWSLPAQASAGK